MTSVNGKCEVWGICLAGGRSSRMGQDKASLPHPAGGTFLAHAFAVLSELLETVLVSCSTDQPITSYPTIADLLPNCGPCGAVYSCLRYAHENGAQAILVIPCDLPCITSGILSRLLTHWVHHPAPAILYQNPVNGRREMTCGIYGMECLPFLEQAITKKNYSLFHAIPEDYITLVEISSEYLKLFENCNSPADLERLNNLHS